MGKVPDEVLALELEVSIAAIERAREKLGIREWRPSWLTDPIFRVLGKTSDERLAAYAGTSSTEVRRWRQRYNLARHVASGTDAEWLTVDILLRLGQVPDDELAAELGRPLKAIRAARRRADIAAIRRSRRATVPSTAPPVLVDRVVAALAQGPCTLAELATAVQISGDALSPVLHELRSQGWLTVEGSHWRLV